jgi:hypothetical protein
VTALESITDQAIAAAIHSAGWRQGSACSLDLWDFHKPLMPTGSIELMQSEPSGIWVPFLASQACDIVSDSLKKEPHAEFILGRVDVPKNDAISLQRTPRRLQLKHPHRPYAEFRVHDRWLVDRARMLELTRDAALDLDWRDGIDLGKWIGARYARYPLPNELAKRMPYGEEKIQRWLKAINVDVLEIRIKVTPPNDELTDIADLYNVQMFVIAKPGGLSSDSRKEAFDKFKAWMTSRPGVTAQVDLVTADKFSYLEMRESHRLDVDLITFGHLAGPSAPAPADW